VIQYLSDVVRFKSDFGNFILSDKIILKKLVRFIS